jgi:hypothetical protein
MNGDHLSPKTRELLNRSIEERIAHIQKDSWIPYSQANKVLQQLEDLLKHPKCDRMPNLAISAQTNNGKTRLMKHFLITASSRREQRWNDRGASFLFAMSQHSRRIAVVQRDPAEAV